MNKNKYLSQGDFVVAIVIPVFNEAEVIGDVIEEVSAAGDFYIIVVDDGSSDNTFNVLMQHDVLALRHKINRGKGAAVKTGIQAANKLGADICVTLDGDGQHDPVDIQTVIEPIKEDRADVVLGTRVIQKEEMPLVKVWANKIGNVVTWLFYGILVTDSQSGFRAYSRYASMIIDTKADKYEYDSKVIREIKTNRLRFEEVSIAVRYTDYSKSKPRKQGFINGIITVYRMIWNLIA